MNINLNDYDLRQIKLMEKKISLFESGELNLTHLVDDLSGLLNVINTAPNSWEQECRTEINRLDMIKNGIEDGSISRWKGNSEEDLYLSIKKLKRLLNSILETYLKVLDPHISESAINADSVWFMCPKCNDAWKSNSTNAMVICAKCELALRNPRV